MRHLVTGAGSGIGAVLTEKLHSRGDDLLLLARDQRRADEFVTRWPGVRPLVADLSDPTALALPEIDRLDSLLHVAGMVELGRVADQPASQWHQTLNVNLVAPAQLTRLALPALRSGSGTVVFVNSTAGLQAGPDWASYAASKFGLRALADSLRAEEPEIRVTTVFPSRTATAMQQKVHAQEGKDYSADDWIRPETVADAIIQAIDLGPDATLTEITIRPN